MSSLFRTKSVEQSIAETEEPEHRLKKNLGALDLTVFGVGVIIGAGIFVYTGVVAATNAGPAIAISFAIAGAACALAALCYAEFASTVPVAGSAYTFSYATFGELVAWIIGWDLVLEFTVGASALSVGFSGYLQNVLEGTPFEVPTAIGSAADGVVDLPAVVIALLVAGVLVGGIKLSSRVNQIVVAIKLAVVALVVVVGFTYIDTANYTPFIPPSEPSSGSEGGFWKTPLISSIFGLEPAVFGVAGVIAGAAIVFFAFIGFDVVATTAEETRNPQKNVPIGILGSLAIVTVLYIAVCLVITGMQDYRDIDPNDSAPLATAFDAVGVEWIGNIIAVGATIGLTVVVLILMLGQTRVAFAMARDGLLPPVPRQGPPDLRHAVRHHRHHRRGRGAARGLRGLRDPGRPGQHRHPVRLHARLGRRAGAASDPPGPAARLPDPGGVRRRDAVGGALRLPDAQPHRRDVGAVPGLDGHRTGRLLRLRAHPQPARARRAGGAGRDPAGLTSGRPAPSGRHESRGDHQTVRDPAHHHGAVARARLAREQVLACGVGGVRTGPCSEGVRVQPLVGRDAVVAGWSDGRPGVSVDVTTTVVV